MANPPKKDKKITNKIVSTKPIDKADDSDINNNADAQQKRRTKKVLYIEIDEEVTAIYDRLKQLKVKNVYLVVPKRAMLFQSIVNLKILKRKAEDLDKNVYIITNDPNGTRLAQQIDFIVYDKLEGHKHPSLVSGKFFEDQLNISPLKASINSLEDEIPVRMKSKKFSISELIRGGKRKSFNILSKKLGIAQQQTDDAKKSGENGKLVLVAPNRQALVALIIVSLIILLTISYIALPGSTIKLTPKSNILQTSVNITLADAGVNRAELDTHPIHEIASYDVATTIKRPLTYQATGKDFHGENAKGIITVINMSNQDWSLLAKTRFQTANNLIFRSQSFVTVPRQKGDTPGTIDIPVIADQQDAFGQIVGERGNIGPAKFFLPGLSAENQKRLYAESKGDMINGKTLFTKFITKEDLEAAGKKLAADLRNSSQAELQAMIAKRNAAQKTNLVLLIGSNSIQTSEPVITVPPNLEGQKLDSFDIEGEITANGIAYNRDEFMAILKTELRLKKNPEKNLVHIDESSLTYRTFETDPVYKKIKLTATIKGIEEFEINPEKENGERLVKKIKDHVIGKDIRETRSYIQNLPEISKVTIESWPAWAPAMPSVPDNIKIEVVKGAPGSL
mgnify:CR=1 FL=1